MPAWLSSMRWIRRVRERRARSRGTSDPPVDRCAIVHTDVFIGRFARKLNARARGRRRVSPAIAGACTVRRTHPLTPGR